MNMTAPNHDLERAYKRSYNTPVITREYRPVNMPLGCELPAIRFLERIGVNVHYVCHGQRPSICHLYIHVSVY